MYRRELIKSRRTTNYDVEFSLKGNKKTPKGLVYGTKCVYDEEWATHDKLMKILKASLPEGVR